MRKDWFLRTQWQSASLRKLFGVSIISSLMWVCIGKTTPAQMDIRPDDTLAGESSTLNIQGNTTFIEGGATRGINLFNSFEEFNIAEGAAAYFVVDNVAIENIFSRITGSDPSDILGTLGTCLSGACPNTKTDATLYFMNPNGILFGPDASLDTGGSFVATTANEIEFGSRGVYGTAPSGMVFDLLTVRPSAFLFTQPISQPAHSIESRATLSVPEQHSFLLVGGRLNPSEASTGDIIIREGRLRAPGGQIEIGGLAAFGRVDLSVEDDKLSLSFPDDVARSNFKMTGENNGFAELDVTSGDGGDISIYARNIDILGGSDVCAGIGSASACGSESTSLGSAGSQGGNILFNASETVKISDPISLVINDVYPNAVGNSGDIIIEGESLLLIDGGQLSADTSGLGDSGKIIINVTDNVLIQEGDSGATIILNNVNQNAIGNSSGIEIVTGSLEILRGAQIQSRVIGRGTSGGIAIQAEEAVVLNGRENNEADSSPSAISTGLSQDAEGQGGNIDIVADSLSIENRAQIISNTGGIGNAGNISIKVERGVLLRNSIIITEVTERSGNGRGGDIQISASSLELRDGSSLLADTENIGDAGNITIDVRDAVLLLGQGPGAGDPDQILPSQISTTVEQNAIGRGGEISISANLLSVTNGGFISSSTFGVGDSGGIEIVTGSLEILQGAQIQSRITGRGNSGGITIRAEEDVVLNGRENNAVDSSPSTISTGLSQGAEGQGGNIDIVADSLSVENRAQITSNTEGVGSAGNISIKVEGDVLLRNSDIITEVTEGSGNGRGGDIQISASSLELRDGSSLLADTENIGDAGNIIIDVRNAVLLQGQGPGAGDPDQILPSQISTTVEQNAIGRGGEISISANLLSVTNGGFISSSTFGVGDSGGIDIFAGLLHINDGFITASTFGQGVAGNIFVRVNRLNAEAGGQILASTAGEKNSGEITVLARDEVSLSGSDRDGFPSGIFTSVRENAGGSGGRLTVRTVDLSLEDGAVISARSDGRGTAGTISIDATDRLRLVNSDIVTAAPFSSGGDIQINTSDDAQRGVSVLRGDSDITTNSQGNGGNITFKGPIVAFDDSDILASSSDALGGNIVLGAFFSDANPFNGQLPLDSNGKVDINADGQVASGNIIIPDTSFIQDGLNELPDRLIDPNMLVASSCITRSSQEEGNLVITSTENLIQPLSGNTTTYTIGHISAIPSEPSETLSGRQNGTIEEPQGIYQLADGRLVMSRECLQP